MVLEDIWSHDHILLSVGQPFPLVFESGYFYWTNIERWWQNLKENVAIKGGICHIQSKIPSLPWEYRMAMTNEDMEIMTSSCNPPQQITLCPAWFLIIAFLVLFLSNYNELEYLWRGISIWERFYMIPSREVYRAVSWFLIDVGRVNSLGAVLPLGR